MTDNLRPGVYSQYEVSSTYTSARSGQYAALVARGSSAGGEMLELTSYRMAAQALMGGENERLRGAARVLFDSGVSRVYVFPVGDNGYASALAAAQALENIGAVVCDAQSAQELALVKESVRAASGALRERVAYVGLAGAQAAAQAAEALNDERMAVCCPAGVPRGAETAADALYTAAAVAGLVLVARDPAYNFSGAPLTALGDVERLAEAEIQTLLAAGVCVAEMAGGNAELVRALTTRVKTGGVPDRSLSTLNTVLIIDDVIRTVRETLQLRLRGGRISTRSLDSVHAQVVVALAAKVDDGVVESFGTPQVYSHESDPAVCVVELSFKVAHVLEQIHVTAHVQV